MKRAMSYPDEIEKEWNKKSGMVELYVRIMHRKLPQKRDGALLQSVKYIGLFEA